MLTRARLRDALWPGLAVLAGVAFALTLVFAARATNGVNGFPLDDPWIHLTYARNLQEHHAFTYYPGEPTSAGSTSPLYTLLLAAGFFITHDEKVLSYALGILFQALFLVTLALWARRRLGSPAWAVFAVLLAGFNPHLGILAVSGMETSLLLFLVSLAFYARLSGRFRLMGVALGLTVWVRPDGLILLVVFGLDALLDRWVAGSAAPPAQRKPVAADVARGRPAWLLPLALLVAAYLVFNEVVGGTLLPNTFAAKTAYYVTNFRSDFLRHEVPACFGRGGWLVLVPFLVGACLREAVALVRRKPGCLRAEAGWAVGLVLAYLVLLPYSHRFFRYLVPALPAAALLGLAGLKDLAARLTPGRVFRWRTVAGGAVAAILAASAVLGGRAVGVARKDYTAICRYHGVRHERTARWLHDHTPPDAVVATHDVGAIAYYSGRRVVDMVGLVQPEVIPYLNRPDFTDILARLFDREKVTHVVVLTSWMEVANMDPLFVAEPTPEIMVVFPWIPGRTHLVPPLASALNVSAAEALRAGNIAEAVRIAQQSLAVDSLNAGTWFLLGHVAASGGQWGAAEAAHREAVRHFPRLGEAVLGRAAALAQLGRRAEALAILDQLRREQPGFAGAEDLHRQLSR